MNNSEIKYLSYKLGAKIPGYGDKEVSLEVFQEKALDKGDSCNTFRFSMKNHCGTHVDAPAHFFKNARNITDYAAKSWIFNSPCVVEIKADKNEVIKVDQLEGLVEKKHDILLLKTGFGEFRGDDIYSCSNPMVDPAVGEWLRAERPKIRAIGFDLISIGSFSNRENGRKAHKSFLDPQANGDPVLIIEDMDLSCDLSNLTMVLVAPILITQIDSAPCTVFGVFN